MPRTRGRSRTRSYRSRSSTRSRSSSVRPRTFRWSGWGRGSKYASLNRRVGGFLGIERHFYDIERTSIDVPNTVAGAEVDPATVLCCNAIPEGSGQSERQGRKAQILSWHITGNIVWSDTDIESENMGAVRVLFVLDKQTNGAQLNAEDVLKDPTDTGLDPQAQRNLEFESRFEILRQFAVRKPFDSYSSGGTPQVRELIVPFAVYIPRKINVCYNADTEAISSITDNSLHVIAIKNGTEAVTIKYFSRIRYYS
mgnify:CR=1 FL=1